MDDGDAIRQYTSLLKAKEEEIGVLRKENARLTEGQQHLQIIIIKMCSTAVAKHWLYIVLN